MTRHPLCTRVPPKPPPLTPAEAAHSVREAVILVVLALAWVLVNDAQVLVPVRPIHLVHSGGAAAESRSGGAPTETAPCPHPEAASSFLSSGHNILT